MKQINTKYTNTNINEYAQRNGPSETNPIQRTVRTAHLSVLITVHSCSTQHNTEQFW